MAVPKRSLYLFIATACVAVGAGISFGVACTPSGRESLSQVALEAEIGNAASTRLALESLREGDAAQAIETLEMALSLNVVVLDEFLRELEPPTPDTAIKLLRSIARYRAEHPYSSLVPEADQNVARILAKYAPQ